MADISKIKVGSTVYTLKDISSRSNPIAIGLCELQRRSNSTAPSGGVGRRWYQQFVFANTVIYPAKTDFVGFSKKPWVFLQWTNGKGGIAPGDANNYYWATNESAAEQARRLTIQVACITLTGFWTYFFDTKDDASANTHLEWICGIYIALQDNNTNSAHA